MLVTLIQKKPGGWQEVDQYYRWHVDLPEELKEAAAREGRRIGLVKRTYTQCPGCGRELTRTHIRFSHNCPGTLTQRPVRPKKARMATKEEAQRIIDEHIRTSSPKTVVTVSE